MMATLCHFPAILTLSSPHHKQYSTFNKEQQRFKLWWNSQLFPPKKHFSVCACSIKKARVRRKVKSNAELCYEIREFVADVGLPEGHVPSLKELSQHGRSDLANVVRRRGYKLIRELLMDSAEREELGPEIGDINGTNEDELTGQNERVNKTAETFSSTEVDILESLSGSPNIDIDISDGESSSGPAESSASSSLLMDEDASVILARNSHEVEDTYSGHSSSINPETSSPSQSSGEVEFSANISLSEETTNSSYGQDYNVTEADEEDLLSAEVSVTKSEFTGTTTEPDVFSNGFSTSQESSINLGMEGEGSYNIKMNDEEIKNNFESYFQSTEVSPPEPYSSPRDMAEEPNHYDSSGNSADSTLKEKVADFLRNGNLDTFEDDAYGILYESAAEESNSESGNVNEHQSSISGEADIVDVLSGSNSITASDGNSIPSRQAEAHAMINHNNRDNQALERTSGDNLDVDLDAETMKKNNQTEINHLKFMLHQKELELSHLKEQIEKEKVALSSLQTKAEEEIGKAQKLISEKDAELNAAEESLLGLQEVHVEYSGNGEIVELAGSFNGWHHPIKMDPHLDSDIVEHIGSRAKRVWSTSLWLYPGMYEIKFIVDGHWVLDPHRESIHKGAICNNILRVGR